MGQALKIFFSIDIVKPNFMFYKIKDKKVFY